MIKLFPSDLITSQNKIQEYLQKYRNIQHPTKDKEVYFIVIKRSIHREDVTILSFHVPNNGTSKNMKQKLRSTGEKSQFIFGDFNTPLSITDRTRRQKIKIQRTGSTTNQLDLVDTYRQNIPSKKSRIYFFPKGQEHLPRQTIFWTIK